MERSGGPPADGRPECRGVTLGRAIAPALMQRSDAARYTDSIVVQACIFRGLRKLPGTAAQPRPKPLSHLD
jgi:hypothetical protein